MKPELDPPSCPDCGERVLNKQAATITPVGVFHQDCETPDPDEL